MWYLLDLWLMDWNEKKPQVHFREGAKALMYSFLGFCFFFKYHKIERPVIK